MSHWLSPSVLRPESRQCFIDYQLSPIHTISVPSIYSTGHTCGCPRQNNSWKEEFFDTAKQTAAQTKATIDLGTYTKLINDITKDFSPMMP